MPYSYANDTALHRSLIVSCLMLMAPQWALAEQKSTVTFKLDTETVIVARERYEKSPEGFLLTTSPEALARVLGAAHYVSADDAHEDRVTRTYTRPHPGDRTVGARELTTTWLSVRPVDGRRTYWVAPSGAEEGTAAACESAEAEPWTHFLHGLAHVRWLHAEGQAHKAGHQPVRWVDLRHAASELVDEPALGLRDAARTALRTREAACVPPDAQASRPPDADEVAASVVWHSPVQAKRLALTFDACSTFAYGPFNPQVIQALETLQVPATLFVGGHWAEMHPAELKSLANNPLFEIGNHTYSHPHMRDLSPEQQAQELSWTQALIYNQTGVLPRMFRPPYGEVDDPMLAEVAKAGLYTVEYDLPAGDADVHVSPMRLTQWVVGQATPGSIVIMHMNRPKNHTAEALPQIVRSLRGQGYTFCRMSDLVLSDGSGCQ